MCLERQHMQILTKFLWLQRPVALGDQIDDWWVSWVGGWDRCKVFFVVMVVKEYRGSRANTWSPVVVVRREGSVQNPANIDREWPGIEGMADNLVQSARAGNIVAFEELARRYDRRMLALAWRLTGRLEDAHVLGTVLVALGLMLM